jgi:lactoylglutathione lyase
VLPAARELIDPATVAGADTGSRFQLTIWVDDTDAVCAELASRGVKLLNGPIDREWGVRTASFSDPDGHIWEIAQQIR